MFIFKRIPPNWNMYEELFRSCPTQFQRKKNMQTCIIRPVNELSGCECLRTQNWVSAN